MYCYKYVSVCTIHVHTIHTYTNTYSVRTCTLHTTRWQRLRFVPQSAIKRVSPVVHHLFLLLYICYSINSWRFEPLRHRDLLVLCSCTVPSCLALVKVPIWLTTCVMSTPSNAFLESFKIDLPSTHQTFILMRLFAGEATTTSSFLSRSWSTNDTLLMLRAPPIQTLCQGQLMGSFIFCLSGKLGTPPPPLNEEKRKENNFLVDGPCRHVCGYLFS